jgi:hypothetical protein
MTVFHIKYMEDLSITHDKEHGQPSANDFCTREACSIGLIAKIMPVLLRKCYEVYKNIYSAGCELAYLFGLESY